MCSPFKLNFGRRGHVMTTVEGNLAVAGGTATGAQGDTEVSCVL